MRRAYLSGQMRGLPDNNNEQFERVGRKLGALGYAVMNPAYTRHGQHGKRSEYLREDALMLLVSDEVIVLPNWRNSPGARWEVATAWAFEIPVRIVYESMRSDELEILSFAANSVVIPSERQYHDGRPLVGLCGFARAGKDTFANAMVEQRGWERVAFADPLKDMASDCGWNGQKDEEGRKFLQSLGVAARDHLDPDIWVRLGEERIDRSNNPVVVTDVRFPNELAMVKRRKGTLIWIERPGVTAANAHISEHSVTSVDCDMKYLNASPLNEVNESVVTFLWQNGVIEANQ